MLGRSTLRTPELDPDSAQTPADAGTPAAVEACGWGAEARIVHVETEINSNKRNI